MTKFKKPLLFALCLLPIAIVAGIFVGYYQLDTLSDEVIAEFVSQVGSTEILIVVGAVQTVGYTLFCGFFGYILADKLGLWKPIRFEIFNRKHSRENIDTGVFIIANIIAALVFAAGHLPATVAIFGELTPLIVFRCFLLNGGFGLIFGWLYRKYGIVYSMVSHAAFHIVSKLIWIIFI